MPEGERGEYFVVNFVEPFQGNEGAFGFDLGSNDARLAALARARDSGDPVTTAPITLAQETGQQSGFLILLPVYENGEPVYAIEQRRKALKGFVLVVFRSSDLFSSVLSSISSFKN